MASGIILFLFVGWACWSEVSTASPQPNIVVFLVDDLGWSDVGFNGAEYTTPTIDRVAGESLILNRYYVQSSCSPSRTALLSGRYPHRFGLAHTIITNGFDMSVPPEYDTLADELRGAGYATHMVGKWDIGMSHWSNTPTFRGFDSFVGYLGAATDHYTHKLPAVPGVIGQGANAIPGTDGIDLRNGTESLTHLEGTYGAEIFTRRGVEVIRNHPYHRNPLFLYFANQVVHTPLQAPKAYIEACSHIANPTRRIMCAMAKVCDDNLKDVVDALNDADQWNNTVLLFMTDNGGQTSAGSSNQPFRAGKMTVFEGGVHGVAYIYGPVVGITGGQSTDVLMHTVDWLPTLVHGVGGKLARDSSSRDNDGGHRDNELLPLDGYNMLAALTGDAPSERHEVLLQYDPPFHKEDWYQASWPGQGALIYGEWKLIIGTPVCYCDDRQEQASSRPGSQRCDDGWFLNNGTHLPAPAKQSWTRLYHLGRDAAERYNVAPYFPRIVSWMRSRLAHYGESSPPQLTPDYDPMSNPANYGGVWSPWLGM
ncbi:arylsulfatase B-like [Sycon ciliatum]|uniref:arylsulfatase B-like n=1 Tax=Sycon ciliatum TaxID=27933 RepID=UPI0031F720D2